jgi:anti-anti-sigma regulatory factor
MLLPESQADFYGGCRPGSATFIEEDDFPFHYVALTIMQTLQSTRIERETLELRMLRLPTKIDNDNMPQIMANLDAMLEPGVGVMMDFSKTHTIDQSCLKVFEFANQLASERSTTLGYMGENDQVRALLLSNRFFRDSSSHS